MFEGIDAFAPERPIVVEPGGRVGQRRGLEAQPVLTAAHFARDQSRALQDSEMFRDAVQRDRKAVGDIADVGIVLFQQREDRASSGIGERAKDPVEPPLACGVNRSCANVYFRCRRQGTADRTTCKNRPDFTGLPLDRALPFRRQAGRGFRSGGPV